MVKLDMHPLMHPVIHPWLSIKCMKSVDGCLGRRCNRWGMTGRSDGGWGTPSRGWDRTALRTSNVCHSRKLMMPHSWANHPPAACEKRDRQRERERTEGSVAGTWMQSEEVRCSCGVSWGWGVWVKIEGPRIFMTINTPVGAVEWFWDKLHIPIFFLFWIALCLLPSSASFIESSYLLNFMRNSANVISCQSRGWYFIFHSKKGGGDGRFGFWAEIVIIYSQSGSSNLGDKGEWEEGWGLKTGNMLNRDRRSGLELSKCREILQGLILQLKQKKAFCTLKW